jgi:mono/diheme cytochrome c family protein
MAQPALYKRAWSIRLLSISARALAAVFAGLFLVGPGLHAQQGISEKEVLGVLQRCVQCHGPALQMSKLNLSTREGMLKGGDHGVALVPGNAEESLIYKRITGQVKPAMPLAPVSALTNEEIAAVRDWINAGAPMSSGQAGATNENKADDASLLVYGNYRERTITDENRQWWAFKRPVAKEAPRISDARWNKNPIDAFVRAKQEEKGLTPAPMADRHTLIRRAYLDLIGILPTPTEVDGFVNDKSPRAYENLIDKLLDSPHYGERWARMWLDVARYADSTGYEYDYDFESAWRYRDYVIKAFNQDKPYDRFIKEQLAGDELDNPTSDS